MGKARDNSKQIAREKQKRNKEQQLARALHRRMAAGGNPLTPPAPITLHPVPCLQTPTDTDYKDYREGLKLQRLIERMET